MNFNKSNLYGVNLRDDFLQKTSTFLASNIDMVPFKFLGVKVGGSPKRYSIWGPTIEKLKKRLSLWKGIHLNMGERVVLMN